MFFAFVSGYAANEAIYFYIPGMNVLGIINE